MRKIHTVHRVRRIVRRKPAVRSNVQKAVSHLARKLTPGPAVRRPEKKISEVPYSELDHPTNYNPNAGRDIYRDSGNRHT